MCVTSWQGGGGGWGYKNMCFNDTDIWGDETMIDKKLLQSGPLF